MVKANLEAVQLVVQRSQEVGMILLATYSARQVKPIEESEILELLDAGLTVEDIIHYIQKERR